MTSVSIALALAFVSSALQSPAAPAPTGATAESTIDGVRNYTKVDATIGCAGATEIKALPAIAKLGYKTVLNIREDTEAGADVAESRAAAEALGLKYIHLPFRTAAPEVKTADRFLDLVADRENHPMFIHCGSGNRVAGLWLIKRLVVDKWTEERALSEAKAMGLTSEALQKFALEYAARPKP